MVSYILNGSETNLLDAVGLSRISSFVKNTARGIKLYK